LQAQGSEYRKCGSVNWHKAGLQPVRRAK